MSHLCSALQRITLAVFVLTICCSAFVGCSSKTAPAKTSFTEQDKQQVQELNQQRMDEWGRKIK